MARRKSKKALKAQPKKAAKLLTTYGCPFCGHPNSVECKIDVKLKIGEALCRACSGAFATEASILTEPIDIFFEWMDEARRVNPLAVLASV